MTHSHANCDPFTVYGHHRQRLIIIISIWSLTNFSVHFESARTSIFQQPHKFFDWWQTVNKMTNHPIHWNTIGSDCYQLIDCHLDMEQANEQNVPAWLNDVYVCVWLQFPFIICLPPTRCTIRHTHTAHSWQNTIVSISVHNIPRNVHK